MKKNQYYSVVDSCSWQKITKQFGGVTLPPPKKKIHVPVSTWIIQRLEELNEDGKGEVEQEESINCPAMTEKSRISFYDFFFVPVVAWWFWAGNNHKYFQHIHRRQHLLRHCLCMQAHKACTFWILVHIQQKSKNLHFVKEKHFLVKYC